MSSSFFGAGHFHRDSQVLTVAGFDPLRRPLLDGNCRHHGCNRQRHGAVFHLECRLPKSPDVVSFVHLVCSATF